MDSGKVQTWAEAAPQWRAFFYKLIDEQEVRGHRLNGSIEREVADRGLTRTIRLCDDAGLPRRAVRRRDAEPDAREARRLCRGGRSRPQSLPRGRQGREGQRGHFGESHRALSSRWWLRVDGFEAVPTFSEPG